MMVIKVKGTKFKLVLKDKSGKIIGTHTIEATKPSIFVIRTKHDVDKDQIELIGDGRIIECRKMT